MRHLKKYTLMLSILLVTYSTQAQEANKTSFSLQEAIDYSLKHSPNYLNAELDEKSAEYRRKEVTGLGLPQISGSIDVKDYFDIPTSLLPGFLVGRPEVEYQAVQFGTKYNATAGFSASQLIFSSDYIFGLKAAKEFTNLSKISVTRSKSELVAQVAKAYYTVLISKDRIKLLEANIVRLKKIFDETKAMNQQGFVELIDVERLEVQYMNLVTEKDKTVKLIGLSEIMLKFQMGYKISDSIELTDILNIEGEQFEELNISKIDITKRPDYQILQAQQKLLDIDVKRNKWSYLPTLSAYGSYNLNAQRSTFNFLDFDKNDATKKWYKISLVGVTLNVNIFTGFQRVNKIEQTKIAALKNQNTIRNVEMGAEMEAISAGISYSNAYASVTTQKKNMELAQHIYDVTQKKYQGGVGSNLEIVTAETSLKEAQTNYYNAVYDMLVAKIDYQKAVGTLVK